MSLVRPRDLPSYHCKHSQCIVVLLLLFFCHSAPIRAQKGSGAPPTIVDRSIYVPFDEIENVLGKMKRGVLIPYDEFQRLWGERFPLAPAIATELPTPFVIHGGEVVGTIANDRATLELTLKVTNLTSRTVALPLGMREAIITKFEPEDPSTWITTAKQGYQALLGKQGPQTLRIQLEVPIKAQANTRSLTITPPEAATLRLDLIIPEASVDVGVDGVRAFTTNSQNQGTQVQAFLSGNSPASLTWRKQPPVLSAEVGYLTCEAQISAHFDALSTRINASLSCELRQATANNLTIAVPAPYEVLSASCKNISQHRVVGEGADRSVVIELEKPLDGKFVITLTLEAPEKESGSDPGVRSIPPLALAMAHRQTGLVTLHHGDDLLLEVADATGFLRTDPGAPGAGNRRIKPSLAFRYLQPLRPLVLGAKRREPHVAVDIHSFVTIREDGITLDALVNLDVRYAPLFEVALDIPENMRLDSLAENALVRQTILSEPANGRQILRVLLHTPSTGAFSIPLRLENLTDPLSDNLALPTIIVRGADRFQGTLGVAAQSRFEMNVVDSIGLTPKDIRQVEPLRRSTTKEPLILGFRVDQPHFDLKLRVQERKPKVTCVTRLSVQVDFERAQVRCDLEYTIQYTGVSKLNVLVPASLASSVRFHGAGIREKIQLSRSDNESSSGTEEWELHLQSPALGTYHLTVLGDTELPLGSTTGKLAALHLEPVEPMSVERETGYVALSKADDLEIDTEDHSPALEPIDVKELPPGFGPNVFQAYRFRSRPARIEAQVVRHELEAVLSGIAELMHLDTVVARSGKARTLCVAELKKAELSDLGILLPADAKILTASVDGVAVRPNRREGSAGITLPLPTRQNRSKTVVRVLYEQEKLAIGGAAKKSGSIPLSSPELYEPLLSHPLPVLRLSWRVYIPEENRVLGLGGNMNPIRPHMLTSRNPWVFPLLSAPTSSPRAIWTPGYHSIQKEAQRVQTEAEKQTTGGYALNVELVREGKHYTFYRLDGPGNIVISYVSPAVHIFLKIMCLILAPVLLLSLTRGLGRSRKETAIGFALAMIIFLPFLNPETAQLLNASLLSGLLVMLIWVVQDLAPRVGSALSVRQQRKTAAEERRLAIQAATSKKPSEPGDAGLQTPSNPIPEQAAKNRESENPEVDSPPEAAPQESLETKDVEQNDDEHPDQEEEDRDDDDDDDDDDDRGGDDEGEPKNDSSPQATSDPVEEDHEKGEPNQVAEAIPEPTSREETPPPAESDENTPEPPTPAKPLSRSQQKKVQRAKKKKGGKK